MTEIRFTLIGDGSSDKALSYIVKWLADDLYPEVPSYVNFADFRSLPKPPPKNDTKAQISTAKEYYPYDLLIYHRDAERNDIQIIDERKSEILECVEDVDVKNIVCVVPIKMMESWLLINQDALKKAAGNRNYKGSLILPPIGKIESLTQPKEILHQLLNNASGLKGRNLSKFNPHQAVQWLAEYIQDYSVLRKLDAFKVFENDFKSKVDEILELSDNE